MRTRESKLVRRLSKLAGHIETLEPDVRGLSDARLRAKAEEFRGRLDRGETLDELLPEAFAVVREAAARTIGRPHSTAQLMAASALHLGDVAEMKGGEGSTLAAAPAAYLNALTGDGVHVAAVTDHLARRDADRAGRIHRFLGLSVGVITSGMSRARRRQAYQADITYGGYLELGYDYLRDNMVWLPDDVVQRGRRYAIVDDLDHVLIDNGPMSALITGDGDEVLARITVSSYFRSYRKLAGMTATAQDDADELRRVYLMRVFPIPTGEPVVREDLPDLIYRTGPAKFEAAADDIAERHRRGQPVLADTGDREHLSGLLAARGVPHEVVDGEDHERDAAIMAGAGRAGAVTITVDLAGRGADIVLGGGPGAEAERVREAGGLYVLGTERHPARRLDDQLRGRCGRRGEPGASRFYLSLDDELISGDGTPMTMSQGPDEPVAPKAVTRWVRARQAAGERAERELRERVRAKDEPIDRLRERFYGERRAALLSEGASVASRERIDAMLAEVIAARIDREHPSLDELWDELSTLYPIGVRWQDLPSGAVPLESVLADARAAYRRRTIEMDRLLPDQGGMRELERQIALTVLDRTWCTYLDGERGGDEAFRAMMDDVADKLIGYLFNVQVHPTDGDQS